METRLSNTVPYAGLAPARLDAAPVRDGVRTDLTPPQAVSAQVGAEKSRWTKDQKPKDEPPGNGRQIESSFETDRETGDLVYKIIDQETRATISQYPFESLLKLRAYIRNADEQNNKND